MGTIIEKNLFITEDGYQHETLQEAQAHDAVLELGKEIESEYRSLVYGADAFDMAAWILKHFDRKPE